MIVGLGSFVKMLLYSSYSQRGRAYITQNRVMPIGLASIESNLSASKDLIETSHPRWESMWADGIQPGCRFDKGTISPFLKTLLNNDEIIADGKCLVPGCGRGYDIAALGKSGTRSVLGIDIASQAVTEAKEYLKAKNLADKENIQIKSMNFFDLIIQTDEDKFDFVYDYTFLCALDPSIRQLWAQKMAAVVKPGGELLTLVYPICEQELDGPPFRVSLEIVKELLEPVGFISKQKGLLPPELCHPGRDGTAPTFFKSGFGRWIRQ